MDDYGERLAETEERWRREGVYFDPMERASGEKFQWDERVVSREFIREKEREELYEDGFLKMTCGEAEGWYKQIQNGEILPAGIALAAIYHREKCDDKCHNK